MYIYHEMVWFFTVAKSKLDETYFVVMEVLALTLLNTISFLLNHIAQQNATTPDKIWLSITDLFVGVEHVLS